jgi:hypothetical protein
LGSDLAPDAAESARGTSDFGVCKQQQQQPQREKQIRIPWGKKLKAADFIELGSLAGLLWAVYTTLKVTYLPAADM